MKVFAESVYKGSDGRPDIPQILTLAFQVDHDRDRNEREKKSYHKKIHVVLCSPPLRPRTLSRLAGLAWEATVGVRLRLALADGLSWEVAESRAPGFSIAFAWLSWEAAVGVRDGSTVDGRAEDGGNDGSGELHCDWGRTG